MCLCAQHDDAVNSSDTHRCSLLMPGIILSGRVSVPLMSCEDLQHSPLSPCSMTCAACRTSLHISEGRLCGAHLAGRLAGSDTHCCSLLTPGMDSSVGVPSTEVILSSCFISSEPLKIGFPTSSSAGQSQLSWGELTVA